MLSHARERRDRSSVSRLRIRRRLPVARNNFGGEKRQRELTKQRKKEEKRQRKLDRQNADQPSDATPEEPGEASEGSGSGR
jgi:hypothetical protein